MTSKKYIVKGCPAITEKGRCKLGYEPEYGCFCEYVYDDCKIKQIVNRCVRALNYCAKCGSKPQSCDCINCISIGAYVLAKDIEQLLDVQEVG